MRHNNSKRSRGRGGRRSGSQSLNRSFDSNGPSGKLRGTPAQLAEKYQAMARDARAGRDRVLVESYFQHAEHYQRLANEIAETQAAAAAENEQRQQRSGGRDGDGESRTQTESSPRGDNEGRRQTKSNGADQDQPATESSDGPSEKAEAPRRAPRRKRRAPADRQEADAQPAVPVESVKATEEPETVESADEDEAKSTPASPVEAAE